mgnify:CR=1 FL=1
MRADWIRFITAVARWPARSEAVKSQLARLCRVQHNHKNWLFCWTEVEAKYLDIAQSLIATCSLHGLKQEFITSYYPHQNGLVERMIPTLKERCIHCHRVEALQHVSRMIGDWIEYYLQRCHQAMDMQTPAEAFVLAA